MGQRGEAESSEDAQLEDGWWRELEPEAFDYLFEESRARLFELLEFARGDEQKAALLVGWAVAVIGLTGLIGDLRIGVQSALEITSILALVTSAAAMIFAGLFFRPRQWEIGADVYWLARYRGASRSELRGEVLDMLVRGCRANQRNVASRGRLLRWLFYAIATQSACVVAVQVAAEFVAG